MGSKWDADDADPKAHVARRAPVQPIGASEVFAMFQEGAPKALMIDLRRHKDFAMGHMAGAFCIAAVEEKGREDAGLRSDGTRQSRDAATRAVLKDSSERPTDWKPADKKRGVGEALGKLPAL
ncbi:hypothetical protein T484DRAFT_1828641 [Baffinella frigidus]|nr:hypothetical protein T484DRAFT_1828641 [Cryptophyta sp. CCMP2293]